MIIYEMLRYGKRIDNNNEPFIPATSDLEKQYQDEMAELTEKEKEHGKKIKLIVEVFDVTWFVFA